MKVHRVKKVSRWHDKPYQPQFETEVDQEIPIAEGSTFDSDGNILTLSYKMSELMERSGYGVSVEKPDENPAAKDKAKAESNAPAKDKAKANKSK